MKNFITLFVVLSRLSFAEVTLPGGEIKKDPLLIPVREINIPESLPVRDQFLALTLNSEKDSFSQNDKEAVLQQGEENDSFSLEPGIYYFLGAAALAAVIYFLVPDNDAPAKTTSTFGMPVTPK